MELKLLRYGHGGDSTGGLLFVDGKHFCYTCEDEYREVKVAGETRIPPGRYEIKLRNEGGLTKRYAKRFDFHKGMLHLQNVPGFNWIYIHPGNTDDDTEGCLLVGYSARTHSAQEYSTGLSVAAYTDLYKKVLEALNRGEGVFITVGGINV